MKTYNSPELEVIKYDLADTLTTSGTPIATTVPFIQEGEGIDD